MEWKDSRKEKPSEGGYGVLYAIKRNVQLDLFSDSGNEKKSRYSCAVTKIKQYAFAFYNKEKCVFEVCSRTANTESSDNVVVETVTNAMYKKVDEI